MKKRTFEKEKRMAEALDGKLAGMEEGTRISTSRLAANAGYDLDRVNLFELDRITASE